MPHLVWIYIRNIAVALDVLMNALLGGGRLETLSYRLAKMRDRGNGIGCLLCRLLDLIDARHCDKSMRAYMRRDQ